MSLKKYIKIIPLLILPLLVGSCSNNDAESLFNDDATTRINKKAQELKDLLKSSPDGWRLTYFTDDSRFGGYTFIFRFKDDTTVEMLSDFSGDSTPTEGEYDVNFGAAIKLVFSTNSLIHDLANIVNQGDFEFLYIGNENDQIQFKSNRYFSDLSFEKASADDWANFSNVQAISNYISNFTFGYKIGTDKYNFTYDTTTRYATNREENSDLNFGVGYTTTGIKVSPEIKIGDKSYNTFTLDATTNLLTSPDGEFTMSLVAAPYNISGLYTINVDAASVSTEFLNAFDLYVEKTNIDRWGVGVEQFMYIGGDIGFGNPFIPSLLFIDKLGFGSQIGLLQEGVFCEPTQFSLVKGRGEFNWRFYNHFEPFVDFITANSPYEVETLPDAINPTSVKLISTINSNVWFTYTK